MTEEKKQKEDLKTHPDPVWLIKDKKNAKFIYDSESLLVFSDKELAKKFLEKTGLEDCFPKCFSWEEVVDKFSKHCSKVTVDHRGESGFYRVVQLIKGI